MQRVKLAKRERQELLSLIRRTTASQRDVTRARIALMAHEGYSSAAIAQELGVSVQTVSLWRQRIVRQGGVSQPVNGTEIAFETANDVMTQVPWSAATPRSPEIVGSAIFAIDESRTFMKTASDTAMVPITSLPPVSGGCGSARGFC
jgi:transposase-like protein